ncbi:hypothetical protein BDK51DRAFT_42950 [Blyttiomyces helicus]|uniref:Uncharacterized protein n=1 Tax=Blyttiomyces helicus TaxID=388810 RepID=A0A4P9WJ95_9FUNG|nr:hypothetical protein BDK51DRAFT_42950 [Blyttiomyces helicus]|eukprot:RKO92989.1 hypothetical protein BDK51DRAFT_42950 [Blyttiomyces helicus]
MTRFCAWGVCCPEPNCGFHPSFGFTESQTIEYKGSNSEKGVRENTGAPSAIWGLRAMPLGLSASLNLRTPSAPAPVEKGGLSHRGLRPFSRRAGGTPAPTPTGRQGNATAPTGATVVVLVQLHLDGHGLPEVERREGVALAVVHAKGLGRFLEKLLLNKLSDAAGDGRPHGRRHDDVILEGDRVGEGGAERNDIDSHFDVKTGFAGFWAARERGDAFGGVGMSRGSKLA